MFLKDKILWNKTKSLLKQGGRNVYADLMALGYQYVEEDDNKEELEEFQAKPETLAEEALFQFFESEKKVTCDILSIFFQERNKIEPNYALFRKYFKKGNLKLKELLLFGLDKEPTNLDLLSDLAFFSNFEPTLSTVIERYILACRLESNNEKFKEIVKAFYYDVSSYGYDVFYSLNNIFLSNPIKMCLVNKVKKIIERDAYFEF